MSSRVGTAMPASFSTARSSAAVGLTRSTQTALSGSLEGSSMIAFFKEASEGTNTENMGTPEGCGTGLLGLSSVRARVRRRCRLTVIHPLWRAEGGIVALIRRACELCPRNSRNREMLRQKGHRLSPAARDKSLSAGIAADFNDNGLNGIVAFGAQNQCCQRAFQLEDIMSSLKAKFAILAAGLMLTGCMQAATYEATN